MGRTKSEEITSRQQVVLDTMQEMTNERGYVPTRAELADRMGVKKASIQAILTRLRDKGFIQWEARQARSATTCEPPQSQETIKILQRIGNLEQQMVVVIQNQRRSHDRTAAAIRAIAE